MKRIFFTPIVTAQWRTLRKVCGRGNAQMSSTFPGGGGGVLNSTRSVEQSCDTGQSAQQTGTERISALRFDGLFELEKSPAGYGHFVLRSEIIVID